ncbi:MAG: LysM peptidoglycan-binding domain-containing protein [Pseudomonadota bacterium]
MKNAVPPGITRLLAAAGVLATTLTASATEPLASGDGSWGNATEALPLPVGPGFIPGSHASWVTEDILFHKPSVPEAAAVNVDLLDRLRGRFTLPVAAQQRTDAQRNWYVRHPDYMTRVFERSRPYLHHIVAELEARNMPAELALLPIVESAFDPFAYSHGRAAGLWQIIPGTGRRFGLQQNWWYDGRRDVVESTRAALDYLEFLARRYDGDYELAVAAYNSGEGNVDRAIRRNRKAGKPTDFWSLRLPRETAAYVPKLLALADIVADPAKHGLTLPFIENAAQIDVVDTGGQIDLALAATLAGIDVDTLYRLNPGFNQWATAPKGPHALVVPIELAEAFRASLSTLPDNERMRWKRHKVRAGQTLSHIADEYRVTTGTIKSANKLRGTMIREGQHLMIPTASQPLDAYSQSADQRLARKQDRKRAANRIDHRVQSGDSLWTIARRYGVSTRALASWNGMAPRDTLVVGRKLVVWTDSAVPSGPVSGAPGLTRKVRYTVRNGDSLSRIASRFRVSVNDIARWNNLDVSRILRPGQRLTMFVDVTRQSS